MSLSSQNSCSLRPPGSSPIHDFLERPGRALSRDAILKLNAVWAARLRAAAEHRSLCHRRCAPRWNRNPRTPRYIRTIRDAGYRFEPGSMEDD
jgi:DNA-binding response OmpR family regulator